jgi:hypothetical protein
MVSQTGDGCVWPVILRRYKLQHASRFAEEVKEWRNSSALDKAQHQ